MSLDEGVGRTELLELFAQDYPEVSSLTPIEFARSLFLEQDVVKKLHYNDYLSRAPDEFRSQVGEYFNDEFLGRA